MDGLPRSPTRSAASPRRPTGRVRVHGAGTTPDELAAVQGPQHGRGTGWAHPARRVAGAPDVAPAPPHLRDEPHQSRHVAARADGPHGPRDPGDDPSVRQVGAPDGAGRLPGSHEQGRAQPAHPPVHSRSALDPRAREVAEPGDAQDPGGPRVLLSAPRGRGLPLRQHLRDLRQLRPRPGVRPDHGEPAHRCAGPPGRCGRTGMGGRGGPPGAGHREPRGPPRSAEEGR